MVAFGVMLMVLAAIPSIAAEQSRNVCVEGGVHDCETKHLYLIQTKTEFVQRDTPVQLVLATAQAATTATNAAAAQRAAIVDPPIDLSFYELSDSSSNICAAAMLVVLSLSIGIFVWVSRDRLENSTTPEKVATSCIVLYIVLTIAVDVLIRKFHQEGGDSAFQFSPAVMTALIELGKLAVMIVGACVDWRNTIKCSLVEFVTSMKLMAIPAACFATMNIGRYVSLSGADLDQYRVWRCTDIMFVACIWFTVFKRTPGVKQIVGIGLVGLSCLMMGMRHQDKKASGEVSRSAILTILGIAFLSSLGLVFNEFGLKGSTSMSLFVQNITLYLLTTVLNSAFVVATVPMGQIFQGIGSQQIGLIWLDVALGICVACVLKYADAIAKQLASGWLAPLEPLVGHFLVGTPVTPIMVFATMFAGAGSIVYRLPDGKQEEKQKDVQSVTKQSATEQPASKQSVSEQ